MVLRVILQIVPHGDEDNIREIGRLDIFNKGHTEFEDECEYGAIDLTPKQEGMFTKTVYHKRQHGPWQLVWRIIEELDIR
jgi:hypothetical protein